MPIKPEDYLSLSKDERRQLIDDIKASILRDIETLDSESADAMELRWRFARSSGHPESLLSWDQAKEFMRHEMRVEP